MAKEDYVEEVVCADVDINRAKRLAEGIKGLGTKVGVRAEQLNFSKREDVARAAKGMDLIFNATFPRFNVPILQASLEVGAHYLDLICSPFVLPGVPESETFEGLLAYDDKFKDAGLTAMPGMGMSPGFSDIVALTMAKQLDTVDNVVVRLS